MIRSLVVTVLLVSASCCNSLPKRGRWGLGRDVCQLALAPTYTEQQLQNIAVTTCIAEQSGLQAIIDGLRFRSKGKRSRHLFFGNQCKDIATLLETNGYTTEATTLRNCTATERGMANIDGTFDMDTLKAAVLNKVAGLPIQANVQLGLDGCPDVVAFDVAKYMQCITTYCKTGAAP